MRNCGMNVDRFDYTITRNMLKQTRVREQHVKHYLNDAENLYGVQSEYQGIPNFMVWAEDQTWANVLGRSVELDHVVGVIGRYTVNMTDEELELFLPILQQLESLYGIHHISEYADSFEIHTTVNGKAKRLLITVMNMIDFALEPETLQHWWSRGTLN